MQQRRDPGKARRVLTWTIGVFALVQLALNVYIDSRHPEWYDAEYGARLAVLRQRLREQPGRPLLLLVGSSRTEMSFLPERLPPLATAGGARPLPFNFSHLGAGPVMNLLEVKRLLQDGLRPTWLIVEVMPSQLGDDRQRILTATASVRDLSLIRRYVNPWRTYWVFVRGRLFPCYRQRLFLMDKVLPQWLPPDAATEQEQICLGPLGGDYSWQAVAHLSAPEVRRRTAVSRASYLPALRNFRFADISTRAMTELLTVCRQQNIQAVLLLSPESREFQSWYPPEVWQQIEGYCRGLSREHGVPLIDARDWLPDGDFADSHHVQLHGADRFTRRLGADVLAPLVQGKLAGSDAAGVAGVNLRRPQAPGSE